MKMNYFPLFLLLPILCLTFISCSSNSNGDYYDNILQKIVIEDICLEIPIDWVYDDKMSDSTTSIYTQHDGSGIAKNIFIAAVSELYETVDAPIDELAVNYADGLSSNSSISNVLVLESQSISDYPAAVVSYNQKIDNYDYFCKAYAVLKEDAIVSFSLASRNDDFELFDTSMLLAYKEESEATPAAGEVERADPINPATTLGEQNALESAYAYLSSLSFSYTGLIEQLEHEGFTNAEATYAADNCGADWNEQAAKSAQSYLDFSSFSRDGLIDQLQYEGFTYDQAVY